ncbi:hypothetical protein PM082_022122 [Marasmius tenuissimus]|nr:hypothetical protein PM082_022122 [Marasmius tenuissimus]
MKADIRDFDPVAYDVTANLCVQYGEAAFSREYRKSRVVSKEQLADLAFALMEKSENENQGGGDTAHGDSTTASGPSDLAPASAQGDNKSIMASSNPSVATLTLFPAQCQPQSTTTLSPVTTPLSTSPDGTSTISTGPAATTTLPSSLGSTSQDPSSSWSKPTNQLDLMNLSIPTSAPVFPQPELQLPTNEGDDSWMQSYNFSMFGDMGGGDGSHVNASLQESNMLAQHSYHQYHLGAGNALPYDNPMYINSEPGAHQMTPMNNDLPNFQSAGVTGDGFGNTSQSYPQSSSWNQWTFPPVTPPVTSSALLGSTPVNPVPSAFCPTSAPSMASFPTATSLVPMSMAITPPLPTAFSPSSLTSPAAASCPTSNFVSPPTASLSSMAPLPSSAPSSLPVMEELPLQTSNIVLKPVADSKENRLENPPLPATAVSSEAAVLITKATSWKRHVEVNDEEGKEVKAKKTKTATSRTCTSVLTSVPETETIAARKPERSTRAPIRFIKEHSAGTGKDKEKKGNGQKRGAGSGTKARGSEAKPKSKGGSKNK